MREQVDGRARFALVCAVGSLLVLLTPGAGLFFGLVCTAAFVAGLVGAASIPQG